MRRSSSRLPAIAVIMAAGLFITACSGSSGGSSTLSSSAAATNGTNSSAPATTRYASNQATVIGKSTNVVVNPAVSAALKHAGITVAAVAPAAAKKKLLFPVSGGQVVVATFAGIIDHTGGLTFSHGGKNVTFTKLVINTKTKRLTATFGTQSMPVFDLNLGSLKRTSGSHGIVVASDIKLKITAQTATTLNSGLGVTTFRAGMKFGVATLTIVYAQGHR